MIVVIQCAARKRPDAGCMRMQDGREVIFVADPTQAPAGGGAVYARPDDPSHTGQSWRERLRHYNERAAAENPLGLLPAFKLYRNPVYERLADEIGLAHLYVLSAGWGLISGSFLTPYYDITFTAQAEPCKRRRKRDRYRDFCMLPPETAEPVVFFGGKEYLPLFAALTANIRAPRSVFFSSQVAPDLPPGVTAVRYDTSRRTNWHYECVDAFLDGKLGGMPATASR